MMVTTLIFKIILYDDGMRLVPSSHKFDQFFFTAKSHGVPTPFRSPDSGCDYELWQHALKTCWCARKAISQHGWQWYSHLNDGEYFDL